MGSETVGDILDIHFGNKTDVDLYRISLLEKNSSDHCKKTVWSYPADYLLGYDRLNCTTHTAAMNSLLGLPSLQLVFEKEARHA
jgi:hypothetical protein